jgi:site-specific DNA-methyltransferase (adenine-specific)
MKKDAANKTAQASSRLTPPKQIKRKTLDAKVYAADAIQLLASLDDNCARLVFLDPPFNLGKRYVGSGSDNRPEVEYEIWLKAVLDEAVRILEPGGSLFVYHLPIWGLKIGGWLLERLEFRHWIAVSMKNGFVRGNRLYPAHYSLLYFTKGQPTHFSRPRTKPARCRHCGELIKDYGGYWPVIRQKGINLSDMWEDISPVRHAHTKTRGPNELPEKLVDRVVAIGGRKGRLYVDPFCGSGAGALAAAKRGMRIVAGDLSKKYAEQTFCRIGNSQNAGGKGND